MKLNESIRNGLLDYVQILCLGFLTSFWGQTVSAVRSSVWPFQADFIAICVSAGFG